MTIQPTYHWQFNERKGNIARDAIGGVESRFHRTTSWDGHGRIGNAVRFNSRESRVVFDPEVGQFGTSDFTVAFGIKIMGTDGQNDLDIIGTRSMSGHGNWFSLRLQDKGRRPQAAARQSFADEAPSPPRSRPFFGQCPQGNRRVGRT